MRNVRDVFPAKYLTASDLNSVGPTPVTIRAIWQAGTDVDEATGETTPVLVIAFNEFHKPAKLKSGFAFGIAEVLGEDMDGWKDQLIHVQPVNVMAFGKLHPMIGICPVQPPRGPALPASQAASHKPQAARNLSPIGTVAAGRFRARLKELDGNWDGFLSHLKATNIDAHGDAYGKEIEAVPAWLLPLMKHHLDLLDARKPVTEDDIPF